jgi:hypothetical protein
MLERIATMTDVSLFRLYVLRATYLFVALGAGLMVWPGVISHASGTPLMSGVVSSMLAAVSILAALGIKYPLRMLPVLLFEIGWKAIWLVFFALPLWSAGQLDARTLQSVRDCIVVVVLIAAIPWSYVISTYARHPGARWRSSATPAAAATPVEAAIQP